MKHVFQFSGLLIAILIFTFNNLSAENFKGYDVKYTQVSNSEFSLDFSLNNYKIGETTKNGVTFSKIIFDGKVTTNKLGWAELPFLSTSIQLPDNKNVSVEITDMQYYDVDLNFPLLPSRGTIYRNQDPSTIPYQIDPASIVDEWYPGELNNNSEPYIIRDVRGENIFVYPFQYNSVKNKLRIYTSISIKVIENNNLVTNPLQNNPQKINREMPSIYNSLFINFNNNASKWTNELGEYGEILVIYTSRDATAIQPWITWKKEMGYKVHETQVSTGTNAKTTIQNEYNANTNILYVLIVGDYGDISSDLGTSQNGAMDPMLGCVVGGDNYFDIIVGRFSASSATDVTTQVNKSITYERNPETGGTWYEQCLGIGSHEGPGDDGEIDQDHIDIIKVNKLMPFTYAGGTNAYGASVPTSTVANAINSGVSVINYCGHGAHDYWVTSSYSVSDANASTNGNKLPYAFSVACVVGEFHTGADCLAEAMLQKNGGGAVAFWGGSINQPWVPPMIGQDYANDILTQGYNYSSNPGSGTSTTYGKTTFGSITFNASTLMITESSSTSDWDTYKTWNVFGDPSLQVRTEMPKAITVTNPGVTPGSYTTQILVSGSPFENALVSLYKAGDPQPYAGLTDASGNVTISHSLTGTVKLTVTGFNLDTYYQDVTITVANPPVCDFIADQTTVVAGTTVNFTDLSTNYPSIWNWTFNGGTPNSATTQNPSITYNTPGTYDVSLYVQNSAGNDTELKTSYITVTAITNPPVADFVANNTTILQGQSVDFTDLSTNLPTGWSWTFTGGTPNVSTLENPSGIVYNTAGTYTVELTATNAFGSDTETKLAYITVEVPDPCAAGASGNYEYINSFTLNTINNTSTGMGTGGYQDWTAMTTNLDQGNSYPFTITLGSGYSGDKGRIWIDFNRDGDFDDTGEQLYETATAGVGPYNGSIIIPPTATAGPTIMRVRIWDSTAEAAGVNGGPCGTETWGEVEDYTVNVIAIATTAPVANFNVNATSFCVGGSISFTDLSLNSPSTWSWDFGDGNSSASQNPSNTYTTPGNYIVSLTVTNSQGSDSYNTSITVNDNPSSTIASVVDATCFGDNDGTSTVNVSGGASPYQYQWSSGGSSATETGLSAGIYSVTVTDSNGCISTNSATVSQPSQIIVSVTSGVGSATANVTGGAPGYSYLWSNGGTTATISGLPNGNYDVTVTDVSGCTGTGSVTVTGVGISEIVNGSFNLYPNPTNSILNIITIDEISNVIVYDMIGKELINVNPNDNKAILDLSIFEKGVYLVEIKSLNKVYSSKVIVE